MHQKPPLKGEVVKRSKTGGVLPRRNRIASPCRQTPARTYAPAGAKTGQTQHLAGVQFTIL